MAAGATAKYELTYCPMTMTAEGETQQGTLFLPRPDGTAILYKLEGVSQPPVESSGLRHVRRG